MCNAASLYRPGVRADRRPGRELDGAQAQDGVTPSRCDFSQGTHDEQPLVRPGMRQDETDYAVSFSVPARSGDGYARLTTVRVDANTGSVEAVNRER